MGLMFMAVIAIMGTTAVIVTTTDLKIGGNYRQSVQALYTAEAGIEEALYRLSLFDDGGISAPHSGSMININGLTNNNAAINIDPNGLLSNNIDDDLNGAVDDISDLNYNTTYDNRTWQMKIMLNTSEAGYTDTNTAIYTTTIQPSASWLEYSSSTADGTELTIKYKKDSLDMDGDGNISEIVFYDGSLASPYNVETAATSATGQPVVVISSAGRSQGSTCIIQVEAVHQPVDIQAEGALMVDLSPTLSGSVLISGFNYDGSTRQSDCSPCNAVNWDNLPGIFDNNGVDNHGGAEKFLPWYNSVDQDINLLAGTTPANEEELVTEQDIPYGNKLESSGHKPGVWTTQTVSPNADVFGGNNTESWKRDSAGAWRSLADLLGVTQDQLDAILANANVTESDMDGSGHLQVAPQGIMYIDNVASGQALKITAATPNNTDGWGLMYVTGDLESQKLAFKGLIYVEGDSNITSSYWMMGCIAVKGTTSGNFSVGNATFLYSKDVLERFVNRGMKFVILSWQEVLN